MTSSPFFSRRKTEDCLDTMLFILIQATGYSNDIHTNLSSKSEYSNNFEKMTRKGDDGRTNSSPRSLDNVRF